MQLDVITGKRAHARIRGINKLHSSVELHYVKYSRSAKSSNHATPLGIPSTWQLIFTMLKILRRERKDSAIDVSGASRAGSSATVSLVTTTTSEDTTSHMKASGISFFDLPAELRNAIYDFVISDATLSLPTNLFSGSKKPKLRLKKKKSSATPPINGLLLASKQCRKEYLSVLLSTISVVVEIKDFDFDNLMRVSATLSPEQLESLQSNRQLTLHLHTRNCTQKSLHHLRAWLEFRHQQPASQRLPWKYEFPLDRLLPPTTMGRVRLLRELEYYADSIATLVDLEAEEQKAELGRVIQAHEEKAQWLEEDLEWLGQRSKAMARNVRGLAGGGLR
jgi:hypothetical protein